MVGNMKTIEGKPFVGFRVVEIPLGLVRQLVAENPEKYSGARDLANAYPFLDDLVAVSVNEFDGSLTLVKENGQYKFLEKNPK
jgi:hypothetical protein